MKLELAATYCRELGRSMVAFSSEWAIESWQLSYVWCVRDPIGDSRCIEEFLAKIYSRHPFSTFYGGQQPWEQRVTMPLWLAKLGVVPVTKCTLQQAISSAVSLSDGAHDPDVGEDFRSWLNAVEVPVQGWSITEIETPRNPTGATDIVLFQTGLDYVFLETHLES